MAEGKFVTAINCMDGRVQEPVLKWMKAEFGADYVDMITEPGPDGIMIAPTTPEQASIKNRVLISVNAHGSRIVAIVGHYDCAGFPVPQEEHVTAVRKCVEIIQSWGLSVRILGLWVGETWEVEVISDSGV